MSMTVTNFSILKSVLHENFAELMMVLYLNLSIHLKRALKILLHSSVC